MGDDTAWNTQHELDFLEGLGTHTSHTHDNPPTRLQLLTLYLEALPLRCKWENLSRSTIETACIQMIRKEQIT